MFGTLENSGSEMDQNYHLFVVQPASLVVPTHIYKFICCIPYPMCAHNVTRLVVGHDYHHSTTTWMCGLLAYLERIVGSKRLARSKLALLSRITNVISV